MNRIFLAKIKKFFNMPNKIFKAIKNRLTNLRDEKKLEVKDTRFFIVDPEDRLPLVRRGDFLEGRNGRRYSIDSAGRPYLMTDSLRSHFFKEHKNGINWLKSFFKQFPILYYTIWHLFCPVLMLVNGPRKILKYLPPKIPVFDIGSGPERLGKEFINVDIFPFPEVDIVASASRLPFEDNKLPAIVSESVLEHVAEPHIVAREMERVLKPGGFLYVSAPFIHPYHASPDDFNRWTKSGLRQLFKNLEIVEEGVRSGPLSALLMFLVYWLGVIFSFGYKKAAPFITHALMIVIGPLKFLDLLFYWIPGSDAVATHLYIIAKKR